MEWAILPKSIPIEQRPEAFRSEPPLVRKSSTKPEGRFKGKVLRGFWHKHHAQAGFIPANLLLQHKKPKTKARLEQAEQAGFLAYTAGQEDWDIFTKRMAHEYTVASYEERVTENSLTGEWIVYAQHEGKNHYLTLATHKEPDEEVLKRIALCRDDFPFLNEYPQFKENL